MIPKVLVPIPIPFWHSLIGINYLHTVITGDDCGNPSLSRYEVYSLLSLSPSLFLSPLSLVCLSDSLFQTVLEINRQTASLIEFISNFICFLRFSLSFFPFFVPSIYQFRLKPEPDMRNTRATRWSYTILRHAF